ncbi:MAG: PrsW family intramembrane metalloprotease [Bacteroidales bacterium]|nr:PrsW family glutamic-type intramembrane protease [Bacteroidales bacterium]MDD3130884.1 PrsW family glutamic-type intramembrane protease [Bacteroidales bacterium]NLO52157.1 PrsW family intramembrane metalloprotease [Bacteroidales bacterium]
MAYLIPLFIAPAIFVLLLLIAQAGMERKNLALFASSYLFGFVAALPMIIAIYLVNTYWLVHVESLRRILFYGFILIGFLSELTKFLILRYKYMPNDHLTKPFDGVLFSVMVSMGFATLANIYFYFQWDYTDNLLTVLYAVPFANLLTGVILGFFVGMGKFRSGGSFDSLTGLLAAIFFNGFFSFCLFSQDYLLLAMVAAGTLIICIMLSVRSINTDVKSIM